MTYYDPDKYRQGVFLYTLSTCVHCKRAKKLLGDLGVAFEAVADAAQVDFYIGSVLFCHNETAKIVKIFGRRERRIRRTERGTRFLSKRFYLVSRADERKRPLVLLRDFLSSFGHVQAGELPCGPSSSWQDIVQASLASVLAASVG